jgi:hypothetical protein
MNPLYGLMLFGVAFFGFMVVVGVVKARRKKEKAYYIGALVSFLMLLSSVFVVLNQFVLVLFLFVAIGILSVAGFPQTIKLMTQEPLRELHETDFSVPLRLRDFLTWKGWFKLTSSWGIRKTMCLYSLLNMGGVGGIFFTLSILGMISMVWTAVVTILVGIGSPIFFYRQIGKALERS